MRKLNRELQAAKVQRPVEDEGKTQPSVVRAVVQPKPDVDHMARALLRAAENIKLDPPA